MKPITVKKRNILGEAADTGTLYNGEGGEYQPLDLTDGDSDVETPEDKAYEADDSVPDIAKYSKQKDYVQTQAKTPKLAIDEFGKVGLNETKKPLAVPKVSDTRPDAPADTLTHEAKSDVPAPIGQSVDERVTSQADKWMKTVRDMEAPDEEEKQKRIELDAVNKKLYLKPSSGEALNESIRTFAKSMNEAANNRNWMVPYEQQAAKEEVQRKAPELARKAELEKYLSDRRDTAGKNVKAYTSLLGSAANAAHAQALEGVSLMNAETGKHKVKIEGQDTTHDNNLADARFRQEQKEHADKMALEWAMLAAKGIGSGKVAPDHHPWATNGLKFGGAGGGFLFSPQSPALRDPVKVRQIAKDTAERSFLVGEMSDYERLASSLMNDISNPNIRAEMAAKAQLLVRALSAKMGDESKITNGEVNGMFKVLGGDQQAFSRENFEQLIDHIIRKESDGPPRLLKIIKSRINELHKAQESEMDINMAKYVEHVKPYTFLDENGEAQLNEEQQAPVSIPGLGGQSSHGAVRTVIINGHKLKADKNGKPIRLPNGNYELAD